ncbi:GPI ethanolamine phosphate transferase 1 [Hirsutella minnesotensis 3608]|nr:GPI ethanolamine phosphate transferase 1 [Hirsutella minnesotensis 3608]
MAAVSRFVFLAIAIAFHLVYILSIFDIYFVSPIVSGMRLIGVGFPDSTRAPADRLVLFVGDGLRADKAFQSFPEPYPKSEDDHVPRPLAPYLRSRVLQHGTFGVSHTRVPTESRPGHVALIAGLYEDVSAVATGWKLNPVNFDSLFNRSRHTWSWGSPDILPMFERGAVPGRVDAYMYGAEFEDFSKDATHLDLWVFNHVRGFFAEAATNQTLNKLLRHDKNVFFLHLLGLDTNGHAYRPYSKEYLHNIQVVDKGVREVTELMQRFFADDRTAFIFTADHGMSDWGSHGDGHPDNTRTPLIAWGSGIAHPIRAHNGIAPGHDDYSSDWGLDSIQRHDVSQADVAALMSYLIGTEFPANSVGKLPLPYLSAESREKAQASLANARSILEMYRVKEETKRDSEIRFRPYQPLSSNGRTPEQRVASIQQLIGNGKYEEAIEECDALIGLALEGLRYLQTYDWIFLRALITIGYLGWMAYAVTTVVDMFVLQNRIVPERTMMSTTVFSSVLVILYGSMLISKSPATYYIYALFPVAFWYEVYAHRKGLVQAREVLLSRASGASTVTVCLYTSFFIGTTQLLALSYIHREILTGIFVLLAAWPATYGVSFLQSHPRLSSLWAILCLIMSPFTLLPAMKEENVPLIVGGGALMFSLGLSYLVFEDFVLSDFSRDKSKIASGNSNGTRRIITGVQIGLVLLAILVTRSSALSLQAKQGLPLGNQAVAWVVLVVSLLMPVAYRLQSSTNYMHRLTIIFLTFAPTFVILTISYEGLFYVAFCLLLLVWVRLECAAESFSRKTSTSASATGPRSNGQPSTTIRPLRLSDARISLFFMVLLQSAFFSTGNIASVSSFSLESVCRLLPIFDPFSQGALLVLKIMIPFALLSANLGILNRRLGVAPSALFMTVMAASDILTLYFFWVVKDEGSWLEIGSTISHFAIASLLCVFVAGLEGVSALFIAGVEVEQESRGDRLRSDGAKTSAVG